MCRVHMQVPYESLKRTTRDRKGVVEEFTAIIEALQKATTASAQPQGTHVELLDDVDRRVGTLKRKVTDAAWCQGTALLLRQTVPIESHHLSAQCPFVCQMPYSNCCALQLDELDAVEVAELRRCTARLAHLQASPERDHIRWEVSTVHSIHTHCHQAPSCYYIMERSCI